jgi:hypothetical protein
VSGEVDAPIPVRKGRREVDSLRDARGIVSQDAPTGHVEMGSSTQAPDEAGRLVHHLSFRDAVTIS